MIAVDASALAAIVFGEDERTEFLDLVFRSERALIATPTLLEAKMVVRARRGERAAALLDDLLALPVFEPVPPTVADIQCAYTAFIVFGKGSGHRAGLNYGNLFSYALAKTRGLPLLFKGDDFSHTDVVPAVRMRASS
ncbi:MAG: type II toxin-antitoxin system VapC family toxin [Propionibacteriaceae bacterium]|jgi:ribonuclease VapC|nr:type II toxin-antitoxin system VapC family toxin [Propionibacteriaceae bacterium]